jgi:tubulin epsilon
VFRFSTAVFPSEEDHVVTSPYNALLAASRLIEDADCVLPLENQALGDICDRLAAGAGSSRAGSSLSGTKGGGAGLRGKEERPWDAMNGVAANLLLHVTSSVRFAGSLNVDLNDITTNLVRTGKGRIEGFVEGTWGRSYVRV